MLKTNILLLIATVFLLISMVISKLGPDITDKEFTSCEDFRKYARFNPYSVLNTKWFMIYYWGPPQRSKIFGFRSLSQADKQKLSSYMGDRVSYPVNWTAPTFVMKEYLKNESSLLVQRDDRGLFALYPIYKRSKLKLISMLRDIVFKQTGDNKYIAFMMCSEEAAYVLSRLDEVPPQKQLQDVAARFGIKGRKGKSYLYRGHEWMPIPEIDEKAFWYAFDRVEGRLRMKSQCERSTCSMESKDLPKNTHVHLNN